MKRRIFSCFFVVALSGLSLWGAACGGGGGSINSNFADVSENPILPTPSINDDDADSLVTIPAGANEQNGMIGLITEQDTATVLCVIIDPATGQDADLEICATEKANQESDSVNGICPEADAVTRCASRNVGEGPDFCEVTGATDYLFIIMNLTAEDVTVAYQVIDVTGQPNQDCDDLGITETSIQADAL